MMPALLTGCRFGRVLDRLVDDVATRLVAEVARRHVSRRRPRRRDALLGRPSERVNERNVGTRLGGDGDALPSPRQAPVTIAVLPARAWNWTPAIIRPATVSWLEQATWSMSSNAWFRRPWPSRSCRPPCPRRSGSTSSARARTCSLRDHQVPGRLGSPRKWNTERRPAGRSRDRLRCGARGCAAAWCSTRCPARSTVNPMTSWQLRTPPGG